MSVAIAGVRPAIHTRKQEKMRKSGLQVAAYMAGLAKNGARGVAGMCQKTCHIAWGLPGGEPSAIAEWNSIPPIHKHKDPLTAPVGYPHFWKVGKWGHVAIQAEHEGFVWSTDLPVNDRVGLVSIDFVNKKWKAQYLGWSDFYMDRKLPPAPEAPGN